MAKRAEQPVTRAGFCQGCKTYVERLNLVSPDRYRCDACSAKEHGHG